MAEVHAAAKRRGIELQGMLVLKFVAVSLLAAGFLWFKLTVWPIDAIKHTMWMRLSVPLVGCIIIASALVSKSLQALLAWGPVHFLGRISFGLYLLHNTVIDHVWAAQTERTPVVTAILCYGGAVTLAIAFTFVIDEPLGVHGVKWVQRSVCPCLGK